MAQPQETAETVARLLKHAGDTLISNSAELTASQNRVMELEDQVDALRHDFGKVLARNKTLAAENEQLRGYVDEDARTIESLRAQIDSVANDGARAHALVGNIKREIDEFGLGKDPRDRTNMPSPDELFERFLEFGDLLGLNRDKLLASLTLEEPQEAPPVPEAPRKRGLRERLFGRRTRDNGYIDEMTRKEPEAVRPQMMQSVVEDIAASPLATGGKP